MKKIQYTIGIDYGTDSARAVLINASSGEVAASSTMLYQRWARAEFCNFTKQENRQHPLDYLEALEKVLSDVVSACPDRSAIRAIAVDSTGSTPCFTDSEGQPLALRSEFAEDPDAMFVLWKDHSGVREAEQITKACGEAQTNYACQSGNHYSSECTWAKILHIARTNPRVREAAGGFIEEADFITNTLTGCRDFAAMKVGRCIPAAKQMWKRSWGGFPPDSFLEGIDPMMPALRRLTPEVNYCSDKAAGTLCPEWAEKLGLSTDVVIGVGNCDAHSGAVGAGIEPGKAVLNIGTSACYMAIAPAEEMEGHVIEGVFGEAEDSIIEGYYGLEAGLSAFGDIFAWLRRTLAWPLRQFGIEGVEDRILAELTKEAEKLPLSEDAPIATDFFNGRRCPKPNNFISAGITGLRLGTTAPEIFRALVEAAAFASKAAIDLYIDNGVRVDSLVGIGGITQKSPFVMQMLADVLGRTVEVSDCKDSCALGAAIHAAVAAGLYPDVFAAERALCPGIKAKYEPDSSRHDFYMRRYEKYRKLSEFNESQI